MADWADREVAGLILDHADGVDDCPVAEHRNTNVDCTASLCGKCVATALRESYQRGAEDMRERAAARISSMNLTLAEIVRITPLVSDETGTK